MMNIENQIKEWSEMVKEDDSNGEFDKDEQKMLDVLHEYFKNRSEIEVNGGYGQKPVVTVCFDDAGHDRLGFEYLVNELDAIVDQMNKENGTDFHTDPFDEDWYVEIVKDIKESGGYLKKRREELRAKGYDKIKAKDWVDGSRKVPYTQGFTDSSTKEIAEDKFYLNRELKTEGDFVYALYQTVMLYAGKLVPPKSVDQGELKNNQWEDDAVELAGKIAGEPVEEFYLDSGWSRNNTNWLLKLMVDYFKDKGNRKKTLEELKNYLLQYK